MELLLWRHGEAELGEPDLGRQLTAKGEKQAHRIAQWLHGHLPDTARVLVSPALRAQQTAQALVELSHRKFKTVEQLSPGAGVDELLAAAGWPTARAPVVLVGHQPAIGLLVSQLLAGVPQHWAVKKGAVWWLSGRERDGALQTIVRAVVNPDLA